MSNADARTQSPCEEDDYPAPAAWVRPTWWRDDYDRFVPMARYVIYSAAQGRLRLLKHKTPECAKESEARRKAKQAPAKVAHLTERIAHYKARIPELKRAVLQGCAFAKKENGEPYCDWLELDHDLQQAEHQLMVAERSLRHWRACLPPAASP